MRTLLVIPSKNQERYAPAMSESIKSLSVKPDKVLVMLDRPALKEMNLTKKAYQDNSIVEVRVVRNIPVGIGRPQMNYGVPYFCAGHMRNLAVSYALEENYDSVIFIDGDCYPEKDLIKAHNALLDTKEERVITIGRRCEGKHAWHDQREVSKEHPVPIFNKPNTPITNELFFVDSGVVWTCNMGINRHALRHMVELNEKLYGRRELCSSDFCGTWGGEDGFIGMEAFYTGVTLLPVCDADAGIRHVEHERPLDKYDHETFISYLEERREELLYLLKVHGMECKYKYVPKDIIIGNQASNQCG